MKKLFRLVGIGVISSAFFLGMGHNVHAAALKEGVAGAAVFDLQSRLTAIGYNVGEIDGDYGQATASAVIRFQQEAGLIPDGIAGDETQRAIERFSTKNFAASRGTSQRSLAPRVISTAKQYLGVPYVFGGANPSGFDCSGFVQYVFEQYGIELPRTADIQYGVGMPVSKNELQPGDLVYFSTYLPGASHNGIYIGNGQFINAQSSKGVAIASMSNKYWASRYVGARRILR